MDTAEVVEKLASVHVEHTLGKGAIYEAKNASDAEHSERPWQALKNHRKAVFWSALISMSIVMEGYDTILIGNFFGYPTFQKKYGRYYNGLGWQVSSPWQAGLSNASAVGNVFGAFANGWLCSTFGYRWTMIGSLFFMNAFIFITFFAPSMGVLCAGQVLCGLTWGVFATIGPAYASEVCPLSLRGYLTVFVNLCWAIGQLIAAGVLEGLISRTDQWSYRIPFAIQWAWPLPLMVVCFFAPESPWYFTRNDRLDDAKRSLMRLGGTRTEAEVNGTLAMMVHTIKIENEIQSGTSYIDCFKGDDLRRTEICCLTFAGQVLSGICFAYSPTFFFIQAGMDASNAYKMNVGGTAIAFCGTVISWFLLTNFGRRTLYLVGQALLCVVLLIIGIISASSTSSSALWAQAGFTVFWLFVYSLTVGPICYAIISETSAIRLRPQTICLARNTYTIVNIIANVLEPYMMNPTAWNWKGKTAFFWAGSSFCTAVWAYFRLPEAKGRTYEELDIMFSNRISARKFSKYEVDAYGTHASH